MSKRALIVAVAVCLGGCPEDTSSPLWGAVDGSDGASVGDSVPGLGGPDADGGPGGRADVALDSAADATPDDGLADTGGRVDAGPGDVSGDGGGDAGPGDASHRALDVVPDVELDAGMDAGLDVNLDVAADVTPDGILDVVAPLDIFIPVDGIADVLPLDILELDADPHLDLGPIEADAGPCTPEGGALPAGGGGGTCCGAAEPIGCETPDFLGLCTLPCLGGTVCAQCDDGQCGPGENHCNCPEDCAP